MNTDLMYLLQDMQNMSNPPKAEILQRFFQTHKGGYGEGDIFLGLTVPQQRDVVKKYFKTIPLRDVEELLHSPVHEHRLTALLILVKKFEKEPSQDIIDLYERSFELINNWDLVDASALYILGKWYFDKDRSKIYEWARFPHLWTQRIAVLSTFYFIRQNDFSTTLDLAEALLDHPHHLIHKAVGWMLREVGNRDKTVETAFLDKNWEKMPKIMLSYALEKYSEDERKKYKKGSPKGAI